MFALFVFHVIFAFAQRWSHPPPNFPNVMSFEDWKTFFQPEGYQSLLEHEDRRRVFEDNVAYIKRENSKNTGMVLGVNQFSAMTPAEFRDRVLMQPLNNDTLHKREMNVVHLDAGKPLGSLDWRTTGAVTGVKNQKQCGSCWSFSATGAVEGCVQIASGTLVSLSEQELVSCSKANHGCGGGWPTRAFEWIAQNGGINTERDYPYTATNGYCNQPKAARKVAITRQHVSVQTQSDQQLIAALNRGPVSVLVDAGGNFQSYRSGILTASCGTQLNHAVLAVGYDSSSYLVKNSWGTWWGEQGYIRMGRRVGDYGYGKCGILLQPSQPVACSLVGPDPSPTPGPGPTPSLFSYGNPELGCKEGEVTLKIPNVQGQFCAPECSQSACPSAPSHIRGISSCGYRDWNLSRNFCGIFCNPSYADECDPTKGMTCKPWGQGSGICTYDSNVHGSYWFHE